MDGNNYSIIPMPTKLPSVLKVGVARASAPIITHKGREGRLRKELPIDTLGMWPGIALLREPSSPSPKRVLYPGTKSKLKLLSEQNKTQNGRILTFPPKLLLRRRTAKEKRNRNQKKFLNTIWINPQLTQRTMSKVMIVISKIR